MLATATHNKGCIMRYQPCIYSTFVEKQLCSLLTIWEQKEPGKQAKLISSGGWGEGDVTNECLCSFLSMIAISG
jgi:hypothetical protein